MNKPHRNGFTLIELLVVVAIIALLVGILLPSLAGARRQAKKLVCATHLRAIGEGIWLYWSEENGRVPYVVSPMTNGGLTPGFGNSAFTDAQLDPFDRALWPMSLPNVLMSVHIGQAPEVFVCPTAVAGWPRTGEPYRYTYREAAANQPGGMVSAPHSYLRENFGFLDGRQLRTMTFEMTGDLIRDAQMLGQRRATYVRDMVRRAGDRVTGPHNGGINVLDIGLHIEYRDRETVERDLGQYGSGVLF